MNDRTTDAQRFTVTVEDEHQLTEKLEQKPWLLNRFDWLIDWLTDWLIGWLTMMPITMTTTHCNIEKIPAGWEAGADRTWVKFDWLTDV